MRNDALMGGNKIKYREVRTETGKELRIVGMKCEDAWDFLEPVEFKIENTTIEMPPETYTYMDDPKQDFCQIGFHPILGSSHEYRLGNIFLRNFYVTLDYEQDLILLGISKDANVLLREKEKIQIEGYAYNPRVNHNLIRRTGSAGYVLVGVFFFMAIAIIYYIVEKRRLVRDQRRAALTVAVVESPPKLETKKKSSGKKKAPKKRNDEDAEEALI